MHNLSLVACSLCTFFAFSLRTRPNTRTVLRAFLKAAARTTKVQLQRMPPVAKHGVNIYENIYCPLNVQWPQVGM